MPMLVKAQQIIYTDLETPSIKDGEYQSYKASDGTVFNVGDELIFGKASGVGVFQSIYYGDGFRLPITFIAANSSGLKTAIDKIILYKEPTGNIIVLKTRIPKVIYTVIVEKAIESREIKCNTTQSDEALTELKKAKEKLDLGIIDQAKFDSLKTKLAAYIK